MLINKIIQDKDWINPIDKQQYKKLVIFLVNSEEKCKVCKETISHNEFCFFCLVEKKFFCLEHGQLLPDKDYCTNNFLNTRPKTHPHDIGILVVNG